MAAHTLVSLSLAAEHLAVNGTAHAAKTFRSKLQNVVVTSSVFLGTLLLLGHLARRRFFWLRALHLPSSLLGGLFGWVIFLLVDLMGGEASALSDDWFSVGWNGARAALRHRASGRRSARSEEAPRRGALTGARALPSPRSPPRLLHQHRLLLPLPRHARPARARCAREPAP